MLQPVPDLPLYLGVLKHIAPLARGRAIFLPLLFYDGFLLMWSNFRIEGVLFQSNSRVDSLWECATKSTSFRVQARGLTA